MTTANNEFASPEAIDVARQNGRLEGVIFGMGCFWGPDATLGGLNGVVQTRVGYAGGAKEEPTYGDLADHAEVVRVVFDPQATSLQKLLEEFGKWFHPASARYAGQYRPLLVATTAGQASIVQETISQRWGDSAPKFLSNSAAGARFWAAEAYHQKHRLRRNKALVRQMEIELGDRWDEHLWATKLNSLGEQRTESTRWLDLVPHTLREAYRRG